MTDATAVNGNAATQPSTAANSGEASSGTQDALSSLRNLFGGGAGPVVDQAKSFAKSRPFATAALAGVVGLAVLNTLRGKR